MSGKVDPKTDHLIEVIMRMAKGDLTARAEVGEDNEPIDLVAVGLNMLAEELQHSIESEQRLRETLEARVAERTQELEQKVATIAAQSRTILELSTPVLEIWEGVLVLPLIGAVDTRRAEQILVNLLEAVSSSGSYAAILDITGVPVVDTAVANHFLQTIRAVELLGARVILTGVQPHAAQTMTQLGVDLRSVVTCGSLAAGLRHVLRGRAR